MSSINPSPSNAHGKFSTKISDKALRNQSHQLLKSFSQLTYNPIDLSDSPNDRFSQKQAADDIYDALNAGVAIPKNPQEAALSRLEDSLDQLKGWQQETAQGGNFYQSISRNIEDEAKTLNKSLDKNGHYNLDALQQAMAEDKASLEGDIKSTITSKNVLKRLFNYDSAALVNASARHPETLKRITEAVRDSETEVPAIVLPDSQADYLKPIKPATMGEVIDMLQSIKLLPKELANLLNSIEFSNKGKGWNLTSQAARAGDLKLAEKLEKLGAGPNLFPHIANEFAEAMLESAAKDKNGKVKLNSAGQLILKADNTAEKAAQKASKQLIGEEELHSGKKQKN